MKSGLEKDQREWLPGRLAVRLWRALTFRQPEYTQPIPGISGKRRSQPVAIRVVDCGSGGAAGQEILAMFNPIYDAERFGFYLTASPRQADVLLVTGPVTRNMEAALLEAFEAMPEPRRVVTVGDDVVGEGVFRESYAVLPLPPRIAAACVAHVPGDPPEPEAILQVLARLDFR